jgi:hypothetical protein
MVFAYAARSDFKRKFCQYEQSLDSPRDMNAYSGGRFSWRTARLNLTKFCIAKHFLSMSVFNLTDLCSAHAHFQLRFGGTITQIRQMIEFCATQFTCAKNVFMALHAVCGFVSY